jgi:hypothetical protein
VHQHDPDAVDRCGTEGEFWTSRDADGGIHGSRILTVDPLDVPAIRFEPRADVLCKRNVRRGGTRASCRRTFYIPDETLRHFRHAVERGAELEAAWRHRVDAYGVTHPDMAGQFARMLAGALPDDWETTLPVFMPDSGEMATLKREEDRFAMNQELSL